MSWSLPNTQSAKQLRHKRMMQIPKPLCALHQTASFDFRAFA